MSIVDEEIFLTSLAALFSYPALIVPVIAQLVMSGVTMFSGENPGAGEPMDRGNQWVIAVVGLIGVLSRGTPHPALSGPHPRGREAAQLSAEQRIRWLPRPQVAAYSLARLRQTVK
jgi:hypothetical protein